MLKFILGLIIGGAGAWLIKSKLDSRLGGNDPSFAKGFGGQARVINPEQVERKRENLEEVLKLARSKREISNDDVQEALGVSDATATRYLEELEQQGRLEQIGERGKQVIYRVK